jgi:hypothetical protein
MNIPNHKYGISYDIKWHQMASKASNGIKWHQMASNGIKWYSTVSNSIKRYQMVSNGIKWYHMVSSKLHPKTNNAKLSMLTHSNHLAP